MATRSSSRQFAAFAATSLVPVQHPAQLIDGAHLRQPRMLSGRGQQHRLGRRNGRQRLSHRPTTLRTSVLGLALLGPPAASVELLAAREGHHGVHVACAAKAPRPRRLAWCGAARLQIFEDIRMTPCTEKLERSMGRGLHTLIGKTCLSDVSEQAIERRWSRMSIAT